MQIRPGGVRRDILVGARPRRTSCAKERSSDLVSVTLDFDVNALKNFRARTIGCALLHTFYT